MDVEKRKIKQGNKLEMDDRLRILVEEYLNHERIEQHKEYIRKLVSDNNIQLLEKLIGKRLTFGTAGIRGSMGAGFCQMNDLVIIQTSQGLASYLLEEDEKASKEQGVIIGNDARHNSSRFARLAALAFLQKGIPVYFCDHIIPTPLIAYGVKHYGCIAGIMVTASHNPKNDNGYKVFASNGAQILSPTDKHIQEHIGKYENLKPWSKAWEQDSLLLTNEQSLPKEWSNIFSRVHGDLSKSYFNYIESLVGDRRSSNQNSTICITYTAMHGVGHVFMSRALDIAGFEDIFPVELQKKPDPDFSTVKFPNPEEAGALDLAFETAKHANSNLILANDPDSDRCAAALYDPSSGYKRVLNGNEIGSLLGWWIWYSYKSDLVIHKSGAAARDLLLSGSQGSELEAHPSESPTSTLTLPKKQPADCYMISTAVSSKFLLSMARIEGFHFVETLTGFKYMGNVAHELMREQEKHVLFAYEEAIGYMVDSSILDKDGISASVQLAQCAAYVMSTYGRTLEQHLDWLYLIYGYHFNLNSYYICTDSSIINRIFSELQANYPTDFGPEFIVQRVRDLNNGFDSGTEDKRTTLPISSSSFMVTFFVNDDMSLTIRTSGTEPKIKYYSEIVANLPEQKSTLGLETNNFNEPAQLEAKKEAQRKLRRLVEAAILRCLKPHVYDLEPAS